LATSTLKKLWKNEYFQTTVMIFLIVGVVFGFWYGSRLVLNTDYPMLAVASGSMCMLPGPYCDGWSHPFERTLHVGDLIIVQGVRPEDIYAAPYNESGRAGDIIVFHQLYGDDLIVHRAIEKTTLPNGTVDSFVTKGDGNPGPDQPIPASHLIGRVVLRIPWIGHLALYMRNSTGILIIVALVIVLIVIEFVLPAVTGKKPESDQDEHKEKVPESEGPM
jgi:signal peptidase I